METDFFKKEKPLFPTIAAQISNQLGKKMETLRSHTVEYMILIRK